MNSPNPRLSTSSSADLHVYSQDNAYAYGPQETDDGLEGHQYHPSSPSGRKRSFSITSGSGRSRARAASLSLFSTIKSPVVGGGRREDAPFGSPEYDDALALELDSEDEDGDGIGGAVELRRLSREGRPTHGGGIGGGGASRGYRQSFQPLIREEWYWMGASALSVFFLSVVAVVLTFVG